VRLLRAAEPSSASVPLLFRMDARCGTGTDWHARGAGSDGSWACSYLARRLARHALAQWPGGRHFHLTLLAFPSLVVCSVPSFLPDRPHQLSLVPAPAPRTRLSGDRLASNACLIMLHACACGSLPARSLSQSVQPVSNESSRRGRWLVVALLYPALHAATALAEQVAAVRR